MAKLRLAFFKAKCGAFDDRVIDFWTGGSGYSHCELVINSKRTAGSHIAADGVAYFYYDNIFANGKWDIYEIESPSNAAVSFMETQIGKKYDLLGLILTFIIPIKKQYNDKWWCSEILMAAINKQLIQNHPTNISPNKLVEILKREVPTFKKLVPREKNYKGDLYGRSKH